VTSTLDVGLRASAVALGAALFNAKVAAAAQQVLGPVSLRNDVAGVPLQAMLHLRDGGDPDLAALYEPMLARDQPPSRDPAGDSGRHRLWLRRD
jgi:hypothetical protein